MLLRPCEAEGDEGSNMVWIKPGVEEGKETVGRNNSNWFIYKKEKHSSTKVVALWLLHITAAQPTATSTTLYHRTQWTVDSGVVLNTPGEEEEPE